MLTGKVLDPQGEPVRGVHVFAYLDSRMVGKPVHISAPSNERGEFQLHLGEGGTYFVGARSNSCISARGAPTLSGRAATTVGRSSRANGSAPTTAAPTMPSAWPRGVRSPLGR